MLRDMDRISTAARRDETSATGRILRAFVLLVIRTIAALLLAVLVLFEPLVQPLLCAIALLAFGTAIFFRFLIADPAFPFSGMLALSLICILLLCLYYRVVRLLCFGS